MKRLKNLILLLASITANTYGTGDSIAAENLTKQSLTSAQTIGLVNPFHLGQQINRVGFGLLRQSLLTTEAANVAVAPESIHSALALAFFGASKATETELEKYLGLAKIPLHIALTQKMFNWHSIYGQDEENTEQFHSANKIWGNAGRFEFSKSYADLVKTLSPKDQMFAFTPFDLETHKTVNAWVSETTQEKIPNLLTQPLSPASAAVLVNAFYYKGAFRFPFEKSQTTVGPFAVAKDLLSVHIMNQTEYLPYHNNGTLQMVSMPFMRSKFVDGKHKERAKSEFTLDLIVAKDEAAYEELFAHSSHYDRMVNKLRRTYVNVSVPKFKMSSNTSLKSQLIKSGLENSFSEAAADFTEMGQPKADGSKVYIGDVIHATASELSEGGFEATAATAIVMLKCATAKPEEPAIFAADRTFLYALRHIPTGTVHMLGLIRQPTEVE